MKEKKFSKSLSSKHNVYNNLRKGRRMAAFFVLQKIKLFTSIFQPRMSRMDSNFRACLPTGTADRRALKCESLLLSTPFVKISVIRGYLQAAKPLIIIYLFSIRGYTLTGEAT
jgi:hypothetical protein